MKVSVIIPVFNQAAFIERAILSVLAQPETAECIVVNDGSTDETPEILARCADLDKRVKVVSHENGLNKGPGASRNLGLSLALSPYIAFLDGDDYFLENRFRFAKTELEKNPFIDGVYDAMSNGETVSDMTALRVNVSPHELFENMAPFGKNGHFHIGALTLKREVAQSNPIFDETLELTQDTLWIGQLVLKSKLVPGSLTEPVVVRGIHGGNRITNLELLKTERVKMGLSFLDWSSQSIQPKEVRERIANTLIKYYMEAFHFEKKRSKWSAKLRDLRFLRKLKSADAKVFTYDKPRYFAKLVLHLPVKRHVNFYE